MRKEILTKIAAVLLAVGLGVVAFYPINHWRLYDANLRPLAMTERESWCVGYYSVRNSFRVDDPQVLECQAEAETAEPNITMVPRWFCKGMVESGWPYQVDDCLGIIDGKGLWPLLSGGLTAQWNSGHPRPTTEGQAIIDSNPRGGDRNSESRGDL